MPGSNLEFQGPSELYVFFPSPDLSTPDRQTAIHVGKNTSTHTYKICAHIFSFAGNYPREIECREET